MFEVEIQIQDESGHWRTVASTQNQPQIIRQRLQEAAWYSPGSRVRAIDSRGTLIDML